MKEHYWKRPFDDNPELEDDDAAKAKLGMDMYNDLLKVNDEDKMTFANKTSMWIAYERQLESERPDKERLFNDKLAKYFAQPYGKDSSDAFACMASSILFNPNNEVPELKTEGFSYYHAARTKLIGNYLEKWLVTTKKKHDGEADDAQIINLGAGMDTRAFWDDCLKDASLYVEVDAKEIQRFKEKVLDEIKRKDELPNTICERKVVSMDFSNESTKDLPSYGIQFENKPTCWILEGLIMYLKKDDIDSIIVEISNLSPTGSFIILNFADGSPGWEETSTCSEYCRQLLVDNHGWRHDKTLYFGDPDFSFDRYPEGRPPNKSLGFSFYSR